MEGYIVCVDLKETFLAELNSELTTGIFRTSGSCLVRLSPDFVRCATILIGSAMLFQYVPILKLLLHQQLPGLPRGLINESENQSAVKYKFRHALLPKNLWRRSGLHDEP